MWIPSAPQLILLLLLGGVFVHFMAAGGRTFIYAKGAGIAVFACAARSDERHLADSALAADYAAYRERTGMFLPRFSRPAPGR